jgi:hypothetical protein
MPNPMPKPKTVDETLHPSWQAKKANTAAILPASGTKIVFGDEIAMEGNLPRQKSQKAKPAEATEKLHPSWEAKRQAQALQAKLLSVKPQKIVFE